jgi:hypothetical protein
MKTVYKKVGSGLCALSGLLLASAAWGSVYTFDGLNNAALSGQDNWTAATTSSDVVTGTGFDTSKVVTAGTADASLQNARANDVNFSFPTLTAGGKYYFEFDFMTSNVDSDVYREATFNLSDGEGGVLPSFGIDAAGSSVPQFYIREQPGTEHVGGAISAVPNWDDGDWVRLRITADLTGAGTASFSYKNLTDGDTGYTDVAGLQNVSLGIYTPVATWDTANLKLYRVSSVDTIQVDNLSIAAVPEPASLALVGLGGLLLIRRRKVV